VGYGTRHLHFEDRPVDLPVVRSYGPMGPRSSDVQLVTPSKPVPKALDGQAAENDRVPDPTRFSVLFGGLLLMVVILLLLRWTFGQDKNVPSARLDDPDDPTGLGLLEEVSRVTGATAAEVLRGRLAAAGIRATVSRADGAASGGAYRILVFPDDLKAARVVLSRGALE
jgi:hypothetical protein